MKKKLQRIRKKEKVLLQKKPTWKETIMHSILPILLGIFVSVVLILSIRGLPGNPTESQLNSNVWKDNGPLELSPERGRFALLYSFVENRSVQFSTQIAKFSSPDVAYLSGSYVSLFAPGVSFMVIPGFVIGKLFGLAQVGTFAMIAVFAVINTFLIRKIGILIGIRPSIATISSLIFLFATPAFAYSVTLYQHHISTCFLLVAIYLLLRYKTIWSLFLIWILCSASFVIDYPNLFILFPVGIYAMLQMISIEKVRSHFLVHINMVKVLTLVALIVPMLFFFWFNNESYHNPLTLSGNVERALQVNDDGTPVLESQKIIALAKNNPEELSEIKRQSKSAVSFFKTRNLLNGFYEHFFSADRGMLYFTPIMFIGFLGMFLALKKNMKYAPLFTAIILATVLLYSLWSDPYGGWAFGSRYLIPAYAILSLFIGYLLEQWRKNMFVLLLIFVLTGYSVSVNTLGALTSNRNPPQVEVLGLEQLSHHEEKYTFMRNAQMLDANASKSFIFQTLAKKTYSAWQYYYFVDMIILAGMTGMFLYLLLTRKESYVQ